MLDVRLKRITDLFVEGRVAELGLDDSGQPVLIWVNKLNSFEEEESRRDGQAARTEVLLEMQDEGHADITNARTQLKDRPLAQLVDARVNQKYDEDFVQALNDLETDKEWAEKVEYLRRAEPMLNDASVPQDDARRARFAEVNDAYLNRLNDDIRKLQDQRRTELSGIDREELVEAYLADFVERKAFERYMAEKRVTELFFAIRDCQAVRVDNRWDHTRCDHRIRLLPNRAEVRTLPQGVIETVTNILDQMTATAREAGNSGAPANSSVSPEQPSAAEESTPSSPVETPGAAPLT